MFQFVALGYFVSIYRWNFRFCIYYFKKYSPTECNYEIYDKKMLAIIRRFEKWDVELRNVKFEIRIDHRNLEYFMTVKKLKKRQIKWSLIFFIRFRNQLYHGQKQ